MVKVLAIIPTFSQFNYALKAVNSFLNYTPDSKVVLVDDGSPDWHRIDWSKWPLKRMHRIRYDRNQRDLTRSWNRGLDYAKSIGAEFTVVGNSDLIFTSEWFTPVKKVLVENSADLVGPLTNAPGPRHNQQVTKYYPGEYLLTDDQRYLNEVSKTLRDTHGAKIEDGPINGFCMIAKTKTWWVNAFDVHTVFNPYFRMAGNEDDLQRRWLSKKRRIRVVPGSFIFHYRSVSRFTKNSQHGRYRKRQVFK